jgi:hypothetical protein
VERLPIPGSAAAEARALAVRVAAGEVTAGELSLFGRALGFGLVGILLVGVGLVAYWGLASLTRNEDRHQAQEWPVDDPGPEPVERTLREGGGVLSRPIELDGPPCQEIRELAFSPDGRWLASQAYDSHVILWDLARGRGRSLAPPTHVKGIPVGIDTTFPLRRCVCFSADSQRLAWLARLIGDERDRNAAFVLYDLAADRVVRRWTQLPVSISFVPGSKQLVTAGIAAQDGISWWGPAGGAPVRGALPKTQDPHRHETWTPSPDGSRLLRVYQDVPDPSRPTAAFVYEVWPLRRPFDPTDGAPLLRLRFKVGQPRRPVGVSPDCKWLVIQADNVVEGRPHDVLLVYEAPSTTPTRLTGINGFYALSADGKLVATNADPTGPEAGTVRLVATTSGQVVVDIPRPKDFLTSHFGNRWASCAAFAPDGHALAVGGPDGKVRICRWR